jgi:aldehyde dehydrogenase (NAD+)
MPTILGGTNGSMRVVQEEVSHVHTSTTNVQIFGPVIAASTFRSEKEAIELANSTAYGLGAGVFTSDHAQALRVTTAVDSGTVWCNHYMMTHNGVPFGGFKQSGVGRELGTYGMEEYQQIKAVHHNINLKA